MPKDKRPAHLRPVPTSGAEATAADAGAEETGTPGLTPPLGRGNSAMFLSDVVVELGYASRDPRRRDHPGGAHGRPLGG